MASAAATPQSSSGSNQWPRSTPAEGKFDTGGCLMLSAILSLIFVVLLISIHLYSRYRREYISRPAVEIYHSHPSSGDQGLTAAAIAALPAYLYSRRQGGGVEDCAVCLSSLEEGELVRLLPDCGHLFHVGCIDTWLNSHSTCPVCRREARPTVIRFEFGMMLAAPRLAERFGGGGGAETSDVQAKEGSSEAQRSLRTASGSEGWAAAVEGERDLERQ